MGKFSLLAALGVLTLLAAARSMPQPGSDSSLEMSIETRELMDEMTWNPKTMDESSGDNEISEDYYDASPYQYSDVVLDDETESMLAAKMCAKTAVDFDSFLSDIDTLSDDTRTAFFSEYCPRLERTALCMDDMLNAVKPRVEEEVFIIFKALAKNYPELVDLICKNDGEMIFKLADPTTKKCVKKLLDDVKVYFLPFAFDPKLISQLTETQCETFSQFRLYIEDKLNVCNAPDLMSVYDLFHNALFSVTTCRNYVLTVKEGGFLAEMAHAMPQFSPNSSPEESVEARESMEESAGTYGTMDNISLTSRNSSGSDSSSEMSVEAREIMRESSETYEIMKHYFLTSRNRSLLEVAYEDEIEAMKTAMMCVENSVDWENFYSNIDTLSNENRTAFFSEYCPQLDRNALCMDDLVQAARPFFEEDVFTIVKALADNYPDLVDLICKNNGEMIFKLADPTTKKCIEQHFDNVVEHIQPFADEIEHWDISHLTQTQCETLSELRQYIEGELNVCKVLDVMSVYDLFHNTLFSVTTCRNYVLTRTESGLMTVADATPQPGSDSSSEESVEAREIKQESPEIYGIMGYKSRNGSESDETYEDEIEPMRAAIMCAENSVDLEKFMSDIDTLSNETRTAFFSEYCPQLERTALCMHDVVEATRPLLEEDVFIIVKALTDNYPDAVDLVCKNNGEMIFKLADPTTKKCVETLWDDVMEHMEPFADEVENWDISHLTQAQCETLSGLRQYIEGKLNVCQVPDLMSVYDLFYNTLFSVTTCRNYVTKVTEIENNTVNEN